MRLSPGSPSQMSAALLRRARADVAVEAVGADVELAADEPFRMRRVPLEHLRPRLDPLELARRSRPRTLRDPPPRARRCRGRWRGRSRGIAAEGANARASFSRAVNFRSHRLGHESQYSRDLRLHWRCIGVHRVQGRLRRNGRGTTAADSSQTATRRRCRRACRTRHQRPASRKTEDQTRADTGAAR